MSSFSSLVPLSRLLVLRLKRYDAACATKPVAGHVQALQANVTALSNHCSTQAQELHRLAAGLNARRLALLHAEKELAIALARSSTRAQLVAELEQQRVARRYQNDSASEGGGQRPSAQGISQPLSGALCPQGPFMTR